MSQFLSNCSVEALANAAQSLKKGSLVAFPTETVYGLGADATNAKAVARVYEVKGRPSNHPLIVHIGALKYLEQWISNIPEYGIALARQFWPGPMTLILQRSEIAKDFITGGQNTVGIRIPDDSLALGLLQAFHNLGGAGIAAPSANRFGQVSPTSAKAVQEELGEYLLDHDLVLNGGACDVGIESTIIDCSGDLPKILRPGAVTNSMIAKSMNMDSIEIATVSSIRVSGTLDNHYAPEAKVLLDQVPKPGDGFIAMARVSTPHGVIRLASPESHEDFARLLYDALRAADVKGLDRVVVAQPVGDGIAIAIRDRLKRASS
jgi:L-threonylcarbamoyladenylate synthase